ncbi:MAG: response regulator [Actinomycetota bacterium]|nr:response regulator [Actinomycetota bacterium]
MRSAVVLDDTPRARAMIVAALRNGGFDVLEAATGEEALGLARSRAPDLIIANPLIAGMDSDEFALALSVDPVISEMPIVFCAEADDQREVWCLAEGCDVSHILITPCEPEDVVGFVGEILGPDPDAGSTVRARHSEPG